MLSGLRNFALTFLISAVIFGLLAWGIVGFVVDIMQETIPAGDNTPTVNGFDTDITTQPSGKDTTPGTDATTDATDTSDEPIGEIIGDTFTMLLVGTDYQPEIFDDYDYEQKWEGDGFPDRRNREWGADMIILLRVDKEDRQFIFCPIPRNTRVFVDGVYMQLGDTLDDKGIEFLCGKVSGLTGLNIDYYTKVDVGSIAAAIDVLGTVEYTVPEDMVYSDPAQSLEINLTAGKTELDGAMAAQLLRYVGYENGATKRMNVTIDLCNAILEKFTDIRYLDKATELYEAMKDHVETTFTLDDLLNNLELIFAYSKFNTVKESYPGYNKLYDGVTYFEPSLTSALKKFDAYK